MARIFGALKRGNGKKKRKIWGKVIKLFKNVLTDEK